MLASLSPDNPGSYQVLFQLVLLTELLATWAGRQQESHTARDTVNLPVGRWPIWWEGKRGIVT